MLLDEHYQQMIPRIHTIVPQSSVIGMLLEHEEPYAVVESKQVGLMQHDATSWEVFRNHFVYVAFDVRTENLSAGIHGKDLKVNGDPAYVVASVCVTDR